VAGIGPNPAISPARCSPGDLPGRLLPGRLVPGGLPGRLVPGRLLVAGAEGVGVQVQVHRWGAAVVAGQVDWFGAGQDPGVQGEQEGGGEGVGAQLVHRPGLPGGAGPGAGGGGHDGVDGGGVLDP